MSAVPLVASVMPVPDPVPAVWIVTDGILRAVAGGPQVEEREEQRAARLAHGAARGLLDRRLVAAPAVEAKTPPETRASDAASRHAGARRLTRDIRM